MINKPLYLLLASFLLSSCADFWGKKQDDTVDEIFKEGAIDPNLVPQNVGYVPVYPFFQGFSNPTDVFVGFDELLYVIDDNGLIVLDQAGRRIQTIAIPGATDITQDRRLFTYVAGRVTIDVGGTPRNLAAVYKITNAGTSAFSIVDTIIHPFDDLSRQFTSFRGEDDEKVQFTGLMSTADNRLFVSRTGPVNNFNTNAKPDNGVLIFDKNFQYNRYTDGLNPNSSNLKSALGISSIAGFSAPPQRVFGMNNSGEFIIAQADTTRQVEFRVLWIKEFVDPDLGTNYGENTGLLNFDTSRSSRFLYESFRFKMPSDIFVSPDANGYIFVTDAKTDSVYIFTLAGFEGVNPPATFPNRKQIIASFGGKGPGPFQFDEPSGICFFRRTVYVADKKNGRISRFKLSTDLE